MELSGETGEWIKRKGWVENGRLVIPGEAKRGYSPPGADRTPVSMLESPLLVCFHEHFRRPGRGQHPKIKFPAACGRRETTNVTPGARLPRKNNTVAPWKSGDKLKNDSLSPDPRRDSGIRGSRDSCFDLTLRFYSRNSYFWNYYNFLFTVKANLSKFLLARVPLISSNFHPWPSKLSNNLRFANSFYIYWILLISFPLFPRTSKFH